MTLQEKIVKLLQADDVLSTNEIVDMIPEHNIASVKWAIQKMKNDKTLSPVEYKSIEGKKPVAYWKITGAVPMYYSAKGQNKKGFSGGQQFVHRRRTGTWDEIPKTDMSRGYGYAQSTVL